MSVRAKLAGKLPGDEQINGIDYIAEGLCERWESGDPDNPPAVLIIGVLRMTPKGYGRGAVDGVKINVPLLELARVEALGVLGREPLGFLPVAPAMDQQRLLDVAEKRTGATPLPIDAESDVENYEVL